MMHTITDHINEVTLFLNYFSGEPRSTCTILYGLKVRYIAIYILGPYIGAGYEI